MSAADDAAERRAPLRKAGAAARRYRATPQIVRRYHGDVGPCDIDGCAKRAVLRVDWTITGGYTAPSWVCGEHEPA